MSMPSTPVSQALVIFAKNKKRVSTFYQQALGLDVVENESSHDLLRGNGIELVIHSIPQRIAREIQISKPPQLRENTPLKPAFLVNDLDALREAVTRTGGWLKARDQAWTIRGATVLDGCDPEGNIVQFRCLNQ